MSKIKDENYFQVSGWMINRLQLKGTELCVYAIIYGFTQDGENWFEGSRQYLADFTGVSKVAIDGALSRLIEKGLLVKNEVFKNGVKFNNYKVAPLQETLPPPPRNFTTPVQETLPHNNIKYNNRGNDSNIPPYNPPSGENDSETTPSKKETSKEITAELKRRINTLFKRRESTTWTDKETAKLHQIARRNGVLDECEEIETLYNSDYPYRRTSLGTFMNNWTTELDRARNYKPQIGGNRYDCTTREVDFEPGF
jgi:hypothetical protein